MYLESLTIKNYRKFGNKDNKICFVQPEVIAVKTEEEDERSVVAPSTTLIIGKNNTGKTTVANALKMICNNEQPKASDFNLSYLNGLFTEYKKICDGDNPENIKELESPSLEFSLMINVDLSEEDLLTNLSQFILIDFDDSDSSVDVNIIVKIEITEEAKFKDNVAKIFKAQDNEGRKVSDRQQFDMFYELLSKESAAKLSEGNLYRVLFLDSNGNEAEKFSLKKLINIKEIKANRNLKEGVLSEVFTKIVSFQFSNDVNSKNSLEENITTMNELISEKVGPKSSEISMVLSELQSTEKVDLSLAGNVTHDSVMKGLIKYNFKDGDDYIPEDQFGLGYINLLNIIGEIIHFVDSYEDKSHYSRINLLFIEEPEAFMHPQMQELFIKRIDSAIAKTLEIANSNSDDKKTLRCQIAITTHSSHIVNSKIHSSNTFNNLNYLTSIDRCANSVNLTDESVVTADDEDSDKKLRFIKKHIKYKVSELFFSDAIVFVEGITEETLLNYYLENHSVLRHYYISVFNINGAHGKLYLPLARKLCVPSLIVTDLDIKREKCEKGIKHNKNESCDICGQRADNGVEPFVPGQKKADYVQITSLKNRKTTNSTLKDLNHRLKGISIENSDKIDDIDFFTDENLHVVFQKDPIEGQYATSLEEALILSNYDNDILNDVIKRCKPYVYESIVDEKKGGARVSLVTNSFKLQKKLSKSKSDFSNDLLFNILSSEEKDIPKLPIYLCEGLSWLENRLKDNELVITSESISKDMKGADHD